MRSLCLCPLFVFVTSGAAVADPTSPPSAPPAAPPAPPLVLAPRGLFDPPPPPPPLATPSLRLEAVRVIAQRFAEDWRYPEPGPVFGTARGDWFIGYTGYRPRTRRSAALGAGSVASTLLGEILLAADSPLAGVGAMLTGATLDAAAADVDRDAEARSP